MRPARDERQRLIRNREQDRVSAVAAPERAAHLPPVPPVRPAVHHRRPRCSSSPPSSQRKNARGSGSPSSAAPSAACMAACRFAARSRTAASSSQSENPDRCLPCLQLGQTSVAFAKLVRSRYLALFSLTGIVLGASFLCSTFAACSSKETRTRRSLVNQLLRFEKYAAHPPDLQYRALHRVVPNQLSRCHNLAGYASSPNITGLYSAPT